MVAVNAPGGGVAFDVVPAPPHRGTATAMPADGRGSVVDAISLPGHGQGHVDALHWFTAAQAMTTSTAPGRRQRWPGLAN